MMSGVMIWQGAGLVHWCGAQAGQQGVRLCFNTGDALQQALQELGVIICTTRSQGAVLRFSSGVHPVFPSWSSNTLYRVTAF